MVFKSTVLVVPLISFYGIYARAKPEAYRIILDEGLQNLDDKYDGANETKLAETMNDDYEKGANLALE